jgi:hypothetical protein
MGGPSAFRLGGRETHNLTLRSLDTLIRHHIQGVGSKRLIRLKYDNINMNLKCMHCEGGDESMRPKVDTSGRV